jgi:hypothetical protein
VAAYLGENAASTKCSFDCDLNYRQDGNQSLCYKYGIESMSGGRVEFELKYSLPASELWRALVVKYPKDIEEVYLLGLNQSFGKFLPWHSSICDSRGCWGSMGYLPSKHGPYTNYDTRRQHSAMTLARRDGEEKGKGEVSAEAQGLSKQRRGMGLGGMLLEGANVKSSPPLLCCALPPTNFSSLATPKPQALDALPHWHHGMDFPHWPHPNLKP